jgi:predicted dehydrogenase
MKEMSKIRFGVLSTAKIALDKVIPALQASRHCEVAAIASRELARAQAAAERLGIARAFGSYDKLLADPAIDAVYNPLPNHLHVDWSIRALEAGKHVLVEKPIGLTAAEGQKLVDAAKRDPRLKVMEAFMYRLHPQWQRAKKLVGEGQIGELRTIQSFFAYYNDSAENIRNRTETGGGGLADIGCYCVSLSRFIFDAEPRRVLGIVEYDPRFQTDRLASGILDFGRGTSTFTCGTQLAPHQRVNIFGTRGRVEIDIPFNAPAEVPCTMRHQQGERIEEIALDVCNQYTIQGDRFARAVFEDGPVPTPLDDAVANMRVLEALVASARTGTWV